VYVPVYGREVCIIERVLIHSYDSCTCYKDHSGLSIKRGSTEPICDWICKKKLSLPHTTFSDFDDS